MPVKFPHPILFAAACNQVSPRISAAFACALDWGEAPDSKDLRHYSDSNKHSLVRLSPAYTRQDPARISSLTPMSSACVDFAKVHVEKRFEHLNLPKVALSQTRRRRNCDHTFRLTTVGIGSAAL